MSFLKSSNSFLKKNYFLNKIFPSNKLLVKITISPFSSLNEKQTQNTKDEKIYSTDDRSLDRMTEEKEKINKESSTNDINSYIEYIKKKEYLANSENGNNKLSFIQRIYLYIR